MSEMHSNTGLSHLSAPSKEAVARPHTRLLSDLQFWQLRIVAGNCSPNKSTLYEHAYLGQYSATACKQQKVPQPPPGEGQPADHVPEYNGYTSAVMCQLVYMTSGTGADLHRSWRRARSGLQMKI